MARHEEDGPCGCCGHLLYQHRGRGEQCRVDGCKCEMFEPDEEIP